MLGIFLVGIYNTKVINNEAEGDDRSIVLPETSAERYRMVPKGGQGCDKLIVGQFTCLGKTIHAFPDLRIHTVVLNDWGQVLLLHNGRR
jgi:hypothetical protein